jgi:hypothetical protein
MSSQRQGNAARPRLELEDLRCTCWTTTEELLERKGATSQHPRLSTPKHQEKRVSNETETKKKKFDQNLMTKMLILAAVCNRYVSLGDSGEKHDQLERNLFLAVDDIANAIARARRARVNLSAHHTKKPRLEEELIDWRQAYNALA